MVNLPRRHAHTEPCDRIQNIMVRSAHDRQQNERRIKGSSASEPLVRAEEEQRHPDHERVPKVEGRHRRELVLELVGRPCRSVFVLVHRVDELVFLRQKPRRHTGPAREDDEGDQIARDEGAADSSEDGRGCVFEEVDHEGERGGDVHVGVNLVQGVHPEVAPHDPFLDGELDPDAKFALEGEDLDAVIAGDRGRFFLEREGRDGTTDLINLEFQKEKEGQHSSYRITMSQQHTQYVKSQYQTSIKNGKYARNRLVILLLNRVLLGIPTCHFRNGRRWSGSGTCSLVAAAALSSEDERRLSRHPAVSRLATISGSRMYESGEMCSDVDIV
jgi:hypothetical protein